MSPDTMSHRQGGPSCCTGPIPCLIHPYKLCFPFFSMCPIFFIYSEFKITEIACVTGTEDSFSVVKVLIS